jgi:hypothetical protein
MSAAAAVVDADCATLRRMAQRRYTLSNKLPLRATCQVTLTKLLVTTSLLLSTAWLGNQPQLPIKVHPDPLLQWLDHQETE